MRKNEARLAANKRISEEWKASNRSRRTPSPRRRTPSPRRSSPKRKPSPRRLTTYQAYFKEHYERYSAAAVARGLSKAEAKKVATQRISEEWKNQKACAAGAAPPSPARRSGTEPDTYAEYLKKYYKRVLASVKEQRPSLAAMDASKAAKKQISEQWAEWRKACRR